MLKIEVGDILWRVHLNPPRLVKYTVIRTGDYLGVTPADKGEADALVHHADPHYGRTPVDAVQAARIVAQKAVEEAEARLALARRRLTEINLLATDTLSVPG